MNKVDHHQDGFKDIFVLWYYSKNYLFLLQINTITDVVPQGSILRPLFLMLYIICFLQIRMLMRCWLATGRQTLCGPRWMQGNTTCLLRRWLPELQWRVSHITNSIIYCLMETLLDILSHKKLYINYYHIMLCYIFNLPYVKYYLLFPLASSLYVF